MFYRRSRRLKALAFCLTVLLHLVRAAIVNRTIDDSAGDPITGVKPQFLPPEVWKTQDCAECTIHPDVNRAFGNSFTRATFRPQQISRMSISIPFTGTAIYLFFILANNAGSGRVTQTECNFVLNNGSPVPYRHIPNRAITEFQYGQLVYSRTGLPQRQHQLDIVTEGLDHQVWVNFDYAVYSYDDSPPSPPNVVTNEATTGVGPSPTSSMSNTNVVSAPSSSNALTRTGGAPSTTNSIVNGHENLPSESSNATTGMVPFPTAGSAREGSERGADSSSESSETPIGAIAGGVVGGILFTVAVALLFFCLGRRRRQRKEELEVQHRVDPFVEERGTRFLSPPSSPLESGSSEALYYTAYTPTPGGVEKSQYGLYGGSPPLLSSVPASSDYSSSSIYGGIAMSGSISDGPRPTGTGYMDEPPPGYAPNPTNYTYHRAPGPSSNM